MYIILIIQEMTRGVSVLPSMTKKYLDNEMLFRQYWSMNPRSMRKLGQWLKEQGIVSPNNGKIPVPMTLWKAMWRYAVDNPDDAYQIVLNGLRDSGEFITPEQWEKELVEKRATAYQSKKYYKKLKEYYHAHSLPEPHTPTE